MKTLSVQIKSVIFRLFVFSSLFLIQDNNVAQANIINPENISSSITDDFTNNMSLDDENFITKLIAPNHGKVQIINIGASWCAPCKPVLEQLATLMKEYSDNDVSFSFICVTPDDKATREIYRVRGIDDDTVHFTTNEEYHSLVTSLKSELALPYGILVNKKGIIVDEGSHVRPAEMLHEKINLLLEQDELTK